MAFTHRLLSDCGYSLVESIVGLAIFTTVVIPASAYLVRTFTEPAIPQTIAAIGLAEEYMELTIASRQFYDETKVDDDQTFALERRIESFFGYVTITIIASRVNAELPIVTLRTSRTTDDAP